MFSTADFHARARGSVPGLGDLKESKLFLPHPRVKLSIMGSLRDREVACSASDRQGANLESCVWRKCHLIHLTIPRGFSWHSLAYIYVHKGGLKPDSLYFYHSVLVKWKGICDTFKVEAETFQVPFIRTILMRGGPNDMLSLYHWSFWRLIYNKYHMDIPANTKHMYNICTKSAQRHGRLSIIVQMLFKCFVLAGISISYLFISNRI